MEQKEATKKKFIKTRVIVVLIFLVMLLTYIYISYRGTYLETIEIGQNFKTVFEQNLKYRYLTIGVNFIVLFIAIMINNSGIKKSLKTFFEEEKKEMPKLPSKSIAFILASIISIIASGVMVEKVSLFFNQAFFGVNDPIFNLDIGFYIFQKPFIEMILIYLLGIIVGLTIYSVIYHIIVFNIYFDGISSETLKNSKFLKQITRNIVTISIIFGAYILINTQGIITDKFLTLNDDSNTEIYGAGITDVTIKLWGYRLLAIIIVISVIRAIKAFNNKNTKKIITSILIVPVYLVVLFVIMTGFNLIYINSNELDKEKQYLSYNIENTKSAYGIKIDEIDIDSNAMLELNDIEDNTQLIEKSSIVNEDITLKTIQVTQTSTGYYTYKNSQIGIYDVDGKEQVVAISPREIVSGGNRTYNNKTCEYTHGFGAIITSVTSTDETGNIIYIQKDFDGTNQPIKIAQPRIYFGQQTNSTIVTNSSNKSEFDYPTTTSQNVEYEYDGQAGLKLNFLDRLILAIKEQDVNLAFSSSVNNNSKILINRNIIERAKTIMPYLIYDENPYLVITDEGKLVWVLDAYTVTNKYPYSQPTLIEHDGIKEEINYIRNSVKVLIDAYDGTTQFYITDKTDPIIMAYRNVYKELFMDLDATIPEDISKHFVYPKFLYDVQSSVLERYHNVSTDVLYRSDDVWDKAKYSTSLNTSYSVVGVEQEPYYTMVKTKDSNTSRLGLVQLYNQLDKQNLRAYLVGDYDENGNANLKLYKFAQDTNILGPMQLDMLLGQDETISKELESLNVTGTRIIKNMIMVPINDTVLYVEPIYQLSLNEGKSVPVLKKVVVSAANKVAIGDTLQEAIKKLLSQSAVNIEVENTETVEGLIEAIIKANDNLENSNGNNDWEMMGKDIKKLQELIEQLETLRAEEKAKEEQNNKVTTNTTTEIENTIY